MNTPDNGGPAFPCDFPRECQRGMSLRDWFAGMALPAAMKAQIDCALTGEVDMTKWPLQRQLTWAAETAYQVADAMLAERNKEQS